MITLKRDFIMNTTVRVEDIQGNAFNGETAAHQFVITAITDAQTRTETSFNGTATAYFIRSDEQTLTVSASVINGKIYATLNRDCYNLTGRFTFSIFNQDEGVTTCVYSCKGWMYRTRRDPIIDSGEVVPNIDDVTAEYQRMQTATDAATAAAASALTNFAGAFSPSTAYTAGQYVTYTDGKFYRFTVNHAAGAWDTSHAVAVTAGGELAELKSALYPYNARDALAGVQHVSETKNGVTFTWSGDICTVSTASGGATERTVNIMLDPSPLPSDIVPGQRYRVMFSTTSEDVYLRFLFYDSEDATTAKYIVDTGADGVYMKIPDDAAKWSVGLFVNANVILDTSATVSNIHLITTMTNAELADAVVDVVDLDMAMARTHESVLAGGGVDIKWMFNKYIDLTTGQIKYTTENYSVTDYIRAPAGATAVVTSFASSLRYATYDEDHNVIQVYTGAWGINIRISSEDAAFFAIQYYSTDIETLKSAVSVTFDYQNGIAREEEMRRAVKNETGYSNESGTASGNPILLTDARAGAFEALDAANPADGEIVSVCGKNIFHFQHPAKLGMVSNGVTFLFNMATQTMSISSATGATGTAVSVNATFPASCLKLDGVDAYHNAHFRFDVDTTVTITPNYSVDPFYDSKVEMRVMWVDGSTLRTLPIGYEGVTLVAKAGVQYGLRVRVSTGFVGSLTLRPQIEIGGSSTAYEQYSGCEVPYPSADGSANIFAMPQADQLIREFNDGKITLKFDYLDGAFDVVSTGPASNIAMYNSQYDGLVNGKNWTYIARMTPDAGPVCVSGIPDELTGLAKVQVSDGTTTYTATTSRPIMFVADGSTQYGYRVYVNAGSRFTHRIKPVIATGVEALRLFGAAHPVTSIYTDGSATLTVGYKKATLSENISDAISVASGVKTLTGGRIITPFTRLKKLGPMISFIDDDTTNAVYVQQFHDIFADEGVVGNYAVEMENLETHPGLDEILLGYEQEGFGMLYHCYKQHGDADRYWESGNAMYDESLIRENFYKGLRMYKDVGFNSARYWVTPYGVNDTFIQNLAKEADMECLLSCPTSTYTCNAIIGYGSNVSRWNMPRFIFLSDTDNDWQGRMMIDGCAVSGGWVIFVTHVNSWAAADVATNTARLKGLIQYAKAAGLRVANFNEAYKTFEPLLRLNELL